MKQFIINRETMKRCTKCKIEKPINEFYKRKDGKYGVRGDCKECLLKQMKEHRDKNKEKINKRKTKYYKRINEEAVAIYGGKCQDKRCIETDINTNIKYLEFHHKYGHSEVKEKTRTVYRRIIQNGIQEDIELYCAPCHKRADIRDKTYPYKTKKNVR